MDYQDANSLITKAMKGSQKAFRELCERDGKKILYLCVKLMGDYHSGEDASQEVFIKLHKNITSLKTPETYVSWMRKVIASTCSSMKRKYMNTDNTNYNELDSYADIMTETSIEMLPEMYVENHEKQRELLNMIDELPDRMQTCLRLYYFEDMNTAEIAAMMQVSERTISTQLKRAREKLRAMIMKRDPESATSAMVSMGVLAGVFENEMQAMIPAAAVKHCMAAAGVKTLSLSGAAVFHTVSLKVAAGAVLAGGAVAAAVVVATPFSAQPPDVDAGHLRPISVVTAEIQEEGDASASLPADVVLPDPETAENSQAAETAAEAPAETASPGVGDGYSVRAHVAGSVAMVDRQNKPLQGAALHAPGTRIRMYRDAGGETYTAETDGSGAFDFIGELREGVWRAEMVPPEGFAPAGASASGFIDFTVRAGEAEYGLSFQLTDVKNPLCTIELQSDDCACGHVNPKQVDVVTEDALPVNIRWRVTRESSGAELISGSGKPTESLMVWLRGASDGAYTLTVEATDAAGNMSRVNRNIRIDSGHIDKNQYA
ncbi:MAG: sigma-70 family RNA polymerase sigma factor [Clostridiales Family XIII bacterium]|nr:sigma-70 family RNA polymerase sigma factor [Clostridiales Family XIII bacterium]